MLLHKHITQTISAGKKPGKLRLVSTSRVRVLSTSNTIKQLKKIRIIGTMRNKEVERWKWRAEEITGYFCFFSRGLGCTMNEQKVMLETDFCLGSAFFRRMAIKAVPELFTKSTCFSTL